jgi:hypothetical protein
MTIKEQNILIAEFMELPKVPCNIGTEEGSVYEGYKHPAVAVPISPSSLEYKYKWDWLMPVAERCLCTDEKTDGQHYFINDALLTCNIEVVFDRVVEFIKDYNKSIKN